MKRFALICLLSAWVNAGAVADTYQIDRDRTQVLFFVDHLGFSKSSGEFTVAQGSFTYDPANVAKSSVNVTIDAASIDMGVNERWTAHMKGPDFFNVEKYPQFTFRSTRVEPTGKEAFKIHGELTLLGVTRPFTLDAKFNKAGPHPMNKKQVAGFSATGKLKRSDFGMKYGLPGVGDEVELRLEVEGVAASAATSS